MWALVTLILQMIKFFAASLKLFAVGFDVPVLGECVVAVTKVTLADFQQFIFPSSLRLSSPVYYVIILYQPPPHPPWLFISIFAWPTEAGILQKAPPPAGQASDAHGSEHKGHSAGLRVGLGGKAFA